MCDNNSCTCTHHRFFQFCNEGCGCLQLRGQQYHDLFSRQPQNPVLYNGRPRLTPPRFDRPARKTTKEIPADSLQGAAFRVLTPYVRRWASAKYFKNNIWHYTSWKEAEGDLRQQGFPPVLAEAILPPLDYARKSLMIYRPADNPAQPDPPEDVQILWMQTWGLPHWLTRWLLRIEDDQYAQQVQQAQQANQH